MHQSLTIKRAMTTLVLAATCSAGVAAVAVTHTGTKGISMMCPLSSTSSVASVATPPKRTCGRISPAVV